MCLRLWLSSGGFSCFCGGLLSLVWPELDGFHWFQLALETISQGNPSTFCKRSPLKASDEQAPNGSAPMSKNPPGSHDQHSSFPNAIGIWHCGVYVPFLSSRMLKISPAFPQMMVSFVFVLMCHGLLVPCAFLMFAWFPFVSLIVLCFPLGFPLVSPWFPLGFPLVSPWSPLGLPLVSPWSPLGLPVFPSVFPLGFPWFSRGFPVFSCGFPSPLFRLGSAPGGGRALPRAIHAGRVQFGAPLGLVFLGKPGTTNFLGAFRKMRNALVPIWALLLLGGYQLWTCDFQGREMGSWFRERRFAAIPLWARLLFVLI